MNRPSSRGSIADALGISDSAFTLLRDLIEQRLGVFYDDTKRSLLTDKLSQITAAHDLHSFLDYYYALKYDADSERHWAELADHLSVPETYFWRQPEQFQAFVAHVLPAHTATRRRPLRIWCAACCTGEEPLSILMAVAAAGLDLGSVEIVASDASTEMIARAQRGMYGERSLRNLPEAWRRKYFTQQENAWRVSQDLHRRISWRVVNLISREDIEPLPEFDVIYCRNVFIYFSDAAIEKVAQSFSQKLPDRGLLFLGASESLTRLDTDFSLEEIGQAFVYMNRKQ